MKKYFLLLSVLFFLCCISCPVKAAERQKNKLDKPKGDWSDLYEEEHEVYGSERDEKYKHYAPGSHLEDHDNKYSCMIMWIYRNVDYPKYTLKRFIPILPVWYHLESKIDNRERTLSFIYYNRIDGPDELTMIFPFYHSNLKKNETDRAFLYLFWWGSFGNDDSYYKYDYLTLIPLLFYKKNYEYSKMGNSGSKWINPLFYYKSRYYIKKTVPLNDDIPGDVKNKTEIKSANGNNEYYYRTWWFPIIPVIYRDVHPRGGHQNIFWLIDYSWVTESGIEDTRRIWVMPIYWWRQGDNGYTMLLPVYMHNRHNDGRYFRSVLLLYNRWRGIDSSYSFKDKKYEYTYTDNTLTPVHCSFEEYKKEGSWKGEPEKFTRWWGLLLPFYYKHYDAEEGIHKNLIGFFDWHNNIKGETDRFWFIPFYFSKDDSYSHVIPFYMNWRNDEEKTVFVPFLLYYRNVTAYSESSLKGIVWSSRNTETESESFHILPLIYNWKDKDEESGHVFPFYFSWKDNVEKTYFGPIYYHNATAYSSSWLIGPLFWHSNSESDDYLNLCVPIWYYLTNETDVQKGDVNKNINNNKENSPPGPRRFTRFWFPIIPLIYSSYTSPDEGSHRTLLIFDWKKDREGNWRRIILFPLYFHDLDKSGYLYVIPFYFRPSGWTEEQGISYGLFYYHRWSKEDEVKWSWLIHYYRSNPSQKERVNVWAPLYFSYQYPEWKSSLILPVSFEYQSRNRSIYVNILGISKSMLSGTNPNVSFGVGKHENKKGWYLDTDISWLYDVFSISIRKTFASPWKNEEFQETDDIEAKKSPIKEGETIEGEKKIKQEKNIKEEETEKEEKKQEVNDPEKSKNNIYTAVDEVADKDKKEDVKDNADKKGVSFQKKKSFSRENSINFWGWSFLFGLSAYEEADSKRHFRIIPLTWLTWDEESKDEITWIFTLLANYVSYTSVEEDKEYSAFMILLFPMYASMKDGESYTKGYFINFYWDEYDDKEKYREKTYFWPFVNIYNSPKKSGGRVFPFIWWKDDLENGKRNKRWISLLYYGKKETSEKDNRVVYDYGISPLRYYKFKEGYNKSEKTWFVPILPLVYYSTETEVYNIQTPPQTDKDNKNNEVKEDDLSPDGTVEDDNISGKSIKKPVDDDIDKEKKKDLIKGYKEKGMQEGQSLNRMKKTNSYVFPFYYWSETEETNNGAGTGNKISDFSLYLIFLTYYNRISISQPVGNNQKNEPQEESRFFCLGYYSRNSNAINHWSILFGLVESTDYLDTGNSRFKFLYGLVNKESSKGLSEFYFFPLWYYYNSPEEWQFSLLLGLYKYTEYPPKQNSYRKILFGLFYRKIEQGIRFGTQEGKYYKYNIESRTTWIFPLYYYYNAQSKSQGENYQESEHYCLLWYKYYKVEKKQGKDAVSSTSWYPILPLVYLHSSSDSTHYNVLGIFDWMRTTDSKNGRTWVLPVYYSSWDNQAQEKTDFVFGYYTHASPIYNRQNFLFIFDHREYLEYKKDIYSVLFGIYSYEISPEIEETCTLWGFLTQKKNYLKTGNYEFNALLYLIGYESRAGAFHSRFIPFWYYTSHKDGYSLMTPLGYLSKDQEGDFDLGLWGLLYYRNNNINEHRDRRMWLLGILWNEVHKPERSYKSIGSLWGGLWEKQTEEEKGELVYEKWTLFGGYLYKSIEKQGKITREILIIF